MKWLPFFSLFTNYSVSGRSHSNSSAGFHSCKGAKGAKAKGVPFAPSVFFYIPVHCPGVFCHQVSKAQSNTKSMLSASFCLCDLVRIWLKSYRTTGSRWHGAMSSVPPWFKSYFQVNVTSL